MVPGAVMVPGSTERKENDLTTSYIAGTITVTADSDMVTGVGTGWQTANIAPGFLGVDSANGNPVPVAEILSDTSLRLVKPWRGTTAAGQAYWLSYDTRDGQQTVNNATRLAEYIALLRSTFLTAFNGLTPTENTFPYFGGGATGALAAITAFGRGVMAATGIEEILPARLRIAGLTTTNFDAITENGFYNGTTGATGHPSTGVCVLTHTRHSGASYLQVCVTIGNGATYQRNYTAGAWTAWRRSITSAPGEAVIENSQLPLRLVSGPSSVDPSTITETGWYLVETTQSGMPVDGQRWFIMHQRYSSVRMIQHAYQYIGAGGATYYRWWNGTVWSSWSYQLTPGRLGGTVGTGEQALVDLNADVETGFYYTSGADPERPGGGNYYILHYRHSGNYSKQIAWNSNQTGERQWIREKKNNVWTPWTVVATPIVGTVSQSSGVVTGAIIESGSNANGRWTKFADGTMIVRGSVNISFTSTNKSSVVVTFPQSFVGTVSTINMLAILVRVSDDDTTSNFEVHVGTGSVNGNTIYARNNGGTTSQTRQFDFVAIGSWF